MKKPAAAVKAAPKKSPRKNQVGSGQEAVGSQGTPPPELPTAHCPLPTVPAQAEAAAAAETPVPAPDPRLMATITCAFCGIPYEGAGKLLLTMVELPDGGHLKLAACHLCAVTEHARVTHMLPPEERAKYLVGAGIIAPS